MKRAAVVSASVMLLFAAGPARAAYVPSDTPSPLCCTTNGEVTSVALAGTTAYVGGRFTRFGPYTGGFAAVDPTSGDLAGPAPVVDGTVNAVIADGADGFYIGGSFTSVGGIGRTNLAHIDASGAVDPTWVPQTNGPVYALLRNGSTVYVGGNFSAVQGNAARSSLVAFTGPDGTLDASFTAGVRKGASRGIVYALAFTGAVVPQIGDPLVFAGGDFDATDTTARNNLAGFTGAGTTVAGFNPNVNAVVRALTSSSTLLYLGGDFTILGGGGTPNRAHAAAVSLVTGALNAWDPSASNTVSALARSGTQVYLGGAFLTVGGVGHNGIASVDQTTGVPAVQSPIVSFGSQVGDIRSLAVSGSTVYAAGYFGVANSMVRFSAAAFDVATGTLKEFAPDPGPVFNSGAFAIAASGSQIALGGNFRAAGGSIHRANLAALDLVTGQVKAFDPQVTTASAVTTVDALAVAGATVYAGGRFSTVGGSTTRHNAAAFDAQTGAVRPFDPDIVDNGAGVVSAIVIVDGKVAIGGRFVQVNGSAPRSRLAVFDPVTGVVDPFTQNLAPGAVNALTAAGSTLYAGGSFTTVGVSPRQGLAAFDVSGAPSGTLLPFDAALDNSSVNTLLLGDSSLLIGGAFAQINGATPRVSIATVDPTTAAADALDPGPLSAGGALYASAQSGPTTFLGGGFASLHGTSLAGLAATDLSTGVPFAWNPAPDNAVVALAASPAAGVVVGGTFAKLLTPGVRTNGLAVFALPPMTALAPAATAGDGQASVAFDAAPNGGAAITSYTVTASPGGATATGAASPLTVTGLTNGTPYTLTLTATNTAGTSDPSPASAAITPVAAVTPPPPPVAPPPPPPPAADRTAPAITGLRVTNTRFAPAKGKTAKSAAAKLKLGTTFTFSLSEPATTTIAISRRLPGRRSGKRCVKPGKALKQRCTRLKAVVTLTRAKTTTGRNQVPFTGRVGATTLAAGAYTAAIVAGDASGNASAPQTVRFTVLTH